MILVIDIGTSSLRCTVYNDRNQELNKIQKEYQLEFIDANTVELDSEIVICHLEAAIKETGNWLKGTNYKLDAISVTAQRSSVIPVDYNGRRLHKALMWQDRRAHQICEELKLKWEKIYNICGMKPTPVFSAPKMLYLKNNYREIYDASYKLIGFQEYVIYFLTNQFVTDTSIASRTCLFDIDKKEWSEELLTIFDIDKEKLCEIRPVGSIIGNTTEKIRELLGAEQAIPVVSAGGDQQCAALGMGICEVGDVLINSGTGAYVIAVSDKPIYDSDMSVNCNVSAIPNKWIVEGTVLGSGKIVDWIKREFFDDDINLFTEACENTPIGSNGVKINPYFIGRGTPEWDMNKKGSIINLSLNNKKQDFARAILEGITFELNECLKKIELLCDEKYNKVISSGGMSKNNVYNQIQADVFDKEVIKMNTSEATSLGACISAQMAIQGNDVLNDIKQCITQVYYPISEHKKIYKNY